MEGTVCDIPRFVSSRANKLFLSQAVT